MVKTKVNLTFNVEVEVETEEPREDFDDFENMMKNFALAKVQVVERTDGSEEDSAFNNYVDEYADLFLYGADDDTVEQTIQSHWDKLKIVGLSATGEIDD